MQDLNPNVTMETSDPNSTNKYLLSSLEKTDKNEDKALSNLNPKPKRKRKKLDRKKIENLETKFPGVPPVSSSTTSIGTNQATASTESTSTLAAFSNLATDKMDVYICSLDLEEASLNSGQELDSNSSKNLTSNRTEDQIKFEKDKQNIYK